MGVVNYYSVGGQLQGEQPVGGARLDYLSDARRISETGVRQHR